MDWGKRESVNTEEADESTNELKKGIMLEGQLLEQPYFQVTIL